MMKRPGWLSLALTFLTLALSREAVAALPLHFEPNVGQSSSRADFLARTETYDLFLDSGELLLRLRGGSFGHRPLVWVRFLGADPGASVEGQEPLTARLNYFVGDDPEKWHRDVPTFGAVSYQRVYPGVDMLFHDREERLEFDWIVAPGGRPDRVRLGFEGADELRLEPDGSLALEAAGTTVRVSRPIVYQTGKAGAERREPVSGRYRIERTERGPEVTVELGPYDADEVLVVDPVVSSSTYLGGTRNDTAHATALDAAGNIYLAGQTESVDFPITSFLDAVEPVSHAYVAKLDPTGTQLLFATYLGGTGGVQPFDQMGLAVDAAGSVYLTGETDADDFPTVQPIQANRGGNFDAFLLKLDPSGASLVYSTYLGGSLKDLGRGLAIDGAGNAYVVGITSSSNFPTVSALDSTLGGVFDAFVAKVNPSGTALVFSTFLGGGQNEFGYDIAVDATSSIYVTGYTSSDDFPTRSSIQSQLGGGEHDAFVAQLDPNGSSLLFSTYLGGTDNEEGLGITVDDAGQIYVAGWTLSRDFPTEAPFQPTQAGGEDAFVAKIDPVAARLVYSTYLGGEGVDFAYAVALGTDGELTVAGATSSDEFPLRNPTQLRWSGGPLDAFVTTFDADGSDLLFSTYLGGSRQENDLGLGFGVAVDPGGDIVVAGTTASSDFTVWPVSTAGAALQERNAGGLDAFVTRLGTAPSSDGPEIVLSLRESGGQNVVGISLGNGGPPLDVEFKLWMESDGQAPVSLLGNPSAVIRIPTMPVTEVASFALDPKLFPGTVIAARLVHRYSGAVVRESFCNRVPCNP